MLSLSLSYMKVSLTTSDRFPATSLHSIARITGSKVTIPFLLTSRSPCFAGHTDIFIVRLVETSTEVLRATRRRATLVGFVANWTVTAASASEVHHKVHRKRTEASTQVSRSICHGVAQLWPEQGARRRCMWHPRQWFIRVSESNHRPSVQRMRWPS